MTSADSVTAQLCLACGLCCNGALFKDVELQPADNPAKLLALGLPIRLPSSANRPPKLPQPCAALGAACRCRIYASRPSRCRAFECALFKAVAADKVTTASALRTIRLARQRAETVRRLLDELGDPDEHLALRVRFRRLTKLFETAPRPPDALEKFADLTLAVHDLTVILSNSFYPVAGE